MEVIAQIVMVVIAINNNASLESFTLIGGECTIGEYAIYSSGKHISMGENVFAYSDNIENINVYNSTLSGNGETQTKDDFDEK